MKKLILVRHAKSSWKHPVIDFERPLKKRGLEDSELVSNHFKEKLFEPDLILSSDAKRAKTTAEIFVESLSFQHIDFQLTNKLYDFSGRDLLKVITNCEDNIDTLMVFGHNHAITAFVNTYGSISFENVPTCGLVVMEFEINSWRNIIPGNTTLKIFPKDLK